MLQKSIVEIRNGMIFIIFPSDCCYFYVGWLSGTSRNKGYYRVETMRKEPTAQELKGIEDHNKRALKAREYNYAHCSAGVDIVQTNSNLWGPAMSADNQNHSQNQSAL